MSANQGQLQVILTRFNNWENEAEKEEYIDTLEGLIETYNEGLRNDVELVPDAIYDTLMDYLRELNPDSRYLHEVWSADDTSVPLDADLDMYLIKYPMLSIQTVKSISDKPIKDFQAKLPAGQVEIMAPIKLNGHGARVIWQDGTLVKATSRGRSTNGKDLTNQMKLILGDRCEDFAVLGVVEMRCEVLLPFSRLAEARKHNPKIKSAFSGVASMIRASATPEETVLLDVVFYDILCDDLEFDTLAAKYEYIRDCGFIIPEYSVYYVTRRTLEQDIDNMIIDMDMRTTDYDYYSDGIVPTINDIDLFNEFGAEDKFRHGNLAIKMGRWRQDAYTGIVGHIEWMEGKSRKTPVAVLEEGVLTATGNTVTNIPLYAPLYILLLECYPGNPINFRYGGEAGVVPVTADGRLVTDKELR
jgi:NAD-dependent DNA ligase